MCVCVCVAGPGQVDAPALSVPHLLHTHLKPGTVQAVSQTSFFFFFPSSERIPTRPRVTRRGVGCCGTDSPGLDLIYVRPLGASALHGELVQRLQSPFTSFNC